MLELGLAVGLGMPVLLALGDNVDPQAFDFGLAEPGISLLHLSDDHLS